MGPIATVDDGECIVSGCTNDEAENFDPEATEDDASCEIIHDDAFSDNDPDMSTVSNILNQCEDYNDDGGNDNFWRRRLKSFNDNDEEADGWDDFSFDDFSSDDDDGWGDFDDDDGWGDFDDDDDACDEAVDKFVDDEEEEDDDDDDDEWGNLVDNDYEKEGKEEQKNEKKKN